MVGSPLDPGSMKIATPSPSSLEVRVPDGPGLRHGVGEHAAAGAPPALLAGHELLDGGLDLRAEVGAVEGGLVHGGAAGAAVPAHAVDRAGRAALLEHDADGAGEPHRVVRRAARQQEHVALADDHVPEPAPAPAPALLLHHLEHHRAPVLEEPLRRLVDVVVRPRVRAAHDLESE